jgi:hypothetical protein
MLQGAVKDNHGGAYGRIEEVFTQLRREWSACDMIGVLHHVVIPEDRSDSRSILLLYINSVLTEALDSCCCKDIVRMIEDKPWLEDHFIYSAQSGLSCVEECLPLQALIRSRLRPGDVMLDPAMSIIQHLADPVDVPLFAKVLEEWLTTGMDNEFALREVVSYLDFYGQEGHSAIRGIARRQREKSRLLRLREAVANSLGDDDDTRLLLPEVFVE